MHTLNPLHRQTIDRHLNQYGDSGCDLISLITRDVKLSVERNGNRRIEMTLCKS